jgi:hypothetical protein
MLLGRLRFVFRNFRRHRIKISPGERMSRERRRRCGPTPVLIELAGKIEQSFTRSTPGSKQHDALALSPLFTSVIVVSLGVRTNTVPESVNGVILKCATRSLKRGRFTRRKR